jgi:alkaline phosphatase
VDHFQQLELGKPSYWNWLMKQEFTVNGLQDCRSLNSVVTDSSAAASTWGSGRWIWNGQVNMYPDGTELRTLTQIMNQAGIKCGLVTTATITHATPAGFAVNCDSRDKEAVIAERYLTNSGVDLLMGGGDRFFSPSGRTDKRDLYADFQKAGFTVVKDRVSTLGLRAPKILGIYNASHLPYTVDHLQDPKLIASTPTLAEMAQVAIDNLKDSRHGFLLQIEGAKIDHGCHGNDLAAALFDQIAFEEAVKVAVDFALKDGNTLVVVTADHATGGPALNGAGDEYIDSTAGLRLLSGMKSSYGGVFSAMGSGADAAKVRSVVEAKLGVKLTTEEAQSVVDSRAGKHPLGESVFMRSAGATLAQMLGNHTKVGWTSGNHTSDYVMVSAVGPGKELFNGLTQNTAMFDIMLGLKGLRWRNPTMSFEEAKRHREKNKQALVSRDEFA